MLEPVCKADVDVVIVGAGTAGLAAAQYLTRAGLTTIVLEAAPTVGGRMSTEKVDGFRLDRIGRLLSTSYPELHRTPGLNGLVLRRFSPGVLLHSDGRHHRAATPALPRSARGALTAARALASAPASPEARAGALEFQGFRQFQEFQDSPDSPGSPGSQVSQGIHALHAPHGRSDPHGPHDPAHSAALSTRPV